MDFEDIVKAFETTAASPKNADETLRAQDIQKLTQAWINEKSVPDLLPYEEELLERVLARVRKQIEYIEMNSIELQQHDREIKLLLVIVEMELDRVQFLIRSYVRCRLAKIDRYAIYVRQNDQEAAKLSHAETVYMEKHLELLMDLYNNQFLGGMPEGLQALDETAAGISMVDEPDYDRPVFVKCTRDAAVRIGDEEIELTIDGIYVMRYSAVADLVQSGEVLVI